jgi:hypothetical protein
MVLNASHALDHRITSFTHTGTLDTQLSLRIFPIFLRTVCVALAFMQMMPIFALRACFFIKTPQTVGIAWRALHQV